MTTPITRAADTLLGTAAEQPNPVAFVRAVAANVLRRLPADAPRRLPRTEGCPACNGIGTTKQVTEHGTAYIGPCPDCP